MNEAGSYGAGFLLDYCSATRRRGFYIGSGLSKEFVDVNERLMQLEEFMIRREDDAGEVRACEVESAEQMEFE